MFGSVMLQSAAGSRSGGSAPSLLLDQLSVSASVAFSTRKIRGDYNGPCLRVRRTSDNAEQDIGFDASTGVLDRAAVLAFVGSSYPAYVTIWYDQSVNGLHLTQPDTTKQPSIVDQWGYINDIASGVPSLGFSAQSPNAACMKTISQSVLPGGEDPCMVVATVGATTSSQKALIYYGDPVPDTGTAYTIYNAYSRLFGTDDLPTLHMKAYSSELYGGSNPLPFAPVISGVFGTPGSTALKAYVDGSLLMQQSGWYYNTLSPSQLFVGAMPDETTDPWHDVISELVIVPGESVADRTLLENSLMTYERSGL